MAGVGQLAGVFPGSLDRRVDRSFSTLDLPPSFVQKSEVRKTHKGDFVTDPIVAKARSYEVSGTMAQTRDGIRTALLREFDQNVAEDDRRATMNSFSTEQGLQDELARCSPVQVPLKPNTVATVLFGVSADAVRVQLDEDGHVAGDPTVESAPLDKYARQSCDESISTSFVTVIVWAM